MANKGFFVAALMAGTLLIAGCQSPAAPIQPGSSPGPEGPATGEVDFSNLLPAPLSSAFDMTYATVGGHQLQLDIHYPSVITEKMPTVVYVHSGGWYQGDKEEIQSGFYDAIRVALLERGIAVVSINYRLMHQARFPGQVEDVRAALAFLARERRLALDPERTALMGASSGGHLAALAGLVGPGETPPDQTALTHRPRAVVSLYGVLDLEAAASADFASQYGRLAGMIANVAGVRTGTSSPILTQNSPTAFASADDPPVWLTHGERDGLVPASQSRALHDRMRAAGGQSTLVMVDTSRHGFHLNDRGMKPSGPELISQIEAFLVQHLGV